MFNLTHRRTIRALDAKIAAATAAIDAEKARAAVALKRADRDLQDAIAAHDAAPETFKRAAASIVKVCCYICDMFANLAA